MSIRGPKWRNKINLVYTKRRISVNSQLTFSFLDTPYLPWCLCWCWQICCQLYWCCQCCQAWGGGSTWGSLWCLWICRIWSWSYDLLHMKWSSCWSWILKMEKLLCRMKMNYSLVHRVIQFQRHVNVNKEELFFFKLNSCFSTKLYLVKYTWAFLYYYWLFQLAHLLSIFMFGTPFY